VHLDGLPHRGVVIPPGESVAGVKRSVSGPMVAFLATGVVFRHGFAATPTVGGACTPTDCSADSQVSVSGAYLAQRGTVT